MHTAVNSPHHNLKPAATKHKEKRRKYEESVWSGAWLVHTPSGFSNKRHGHCCWDILQMPCIPMRGAIRNTQDHNGMDKTLHQILPHSSVMMCLWSPGQATTTPFLSALVSACWSHDKGGQGSYLGGRRPTFQIYSLFFCYSGHWIHCY